MTFTADEQEKIRRYFGYSAEASHLSVIEGRCVAVSSTSAAAEETARSLLRQIDKLDTQVQQARPFAARTFQSGTGGTTQYAPGEVLRSLKGEQAGLVRELSGLLALPVYRDIFGGGGWQSSGRLRRG